MEFSGIHSTAIIHPKAQVGSDVSVGPYAIVGENVTLHDGVIVGSHAIVEGFTTIHKNTKIFPKACVGTPPQDLKYEPCKSYVVVGENTRIRECVTVNPGTFEGETTSIGDNCLLMAYSHVAHNCIVKDHVIMANSATLAGHVEVDDYAVIGGLSAVHQFVRIGAHVMVGGMTVVLQDVVPFSLIAGNPSHVNGVNSVGLKRRGFSIEQRSWIKQAHKIIFRNQMTLEESLQVINDQLPQDDAIDCMRMFIQNSQSQRGYAR